MKNMQTEAHFDAETIERLEEQSGLLLNIYEAEFAKDPTSPATESSRSNMIPLRHSINKIYGEAAASDVADALPFATVDSPLIEKPALAERILFNDSSRVQIAGDHSLWVRSGKK